jgi:hypothetical protein
MQQCAKHEFLNGSVILKKDECSAKTDKHPGSLPVSRNNKLVAHVHDLV